MFHPRSVVNTSHLSVYTQTEQLELYCTCGTESSLFSCDLNWSKWELCSEAFKDSFSYVKTCPYFLKRLWKQLTWSHTPLSQKGSRPLLHDDSLDKEDEEPEDTEPEVKVSVICNLRTEVGGQYLN